VNSSGKRKRKKRVFSDHSRKRRTSRKKKKKGEQGEKKKKKDLSQRPNHEKGDKKNGRCAWQEERNAQSLVGRRGRGKTTSIAKTERKRRRTHLYPRKRKKEVPHSSDEEGEKRGHLSYTCA